MKQENGFALNFDRVDRLIMDFHNEQWYNNNLAVTDISSLKLCTFINLIGDDESSRNILSLGLGYDVKDVWGDGNCGFYCLIVGLVQVGKIPKHVLADNNKIAAAAIKMRSELKEFPKRDLIKIWNDLPKSDEGGLSDNLTKFFCLDPNESDVNLSMLLHLNITVTQYFRDIRDLKDEHLED